MDGRDPDLDLGRGLEALNWWLSGEGDGALRVSHQELIPRRILGLLWGLIDGESIEIIPRLGLPTEGSSPTSGIQPSARGAHRWSMGREQQRAELLR